MHSLFPGHFIRGSVYLVRHPWGQGRKKENGDLPRYADMARMSTHLHMLRCSF